MPDPKPKKKPKKADDWKVEVGKASILPPIKVEMGDAEMLPQWEVQIGDASILPPPFTLGPADIYPPQEVEPVSIDDANGLLEPGNIDTNQRPRVINADGTVSTVRSMSMTDGGAEVLVPTISDDGRILADEEAAAAYRLGGKHLGKYATLADAERASQRLHVQQKGKYADALGSTGPRR